VTDTEKGIKSYYFCEIDEKGSSYQRIVTAETICLYTGFTDFNVNKIWEKDIIRVYDITAEDYVVNWSEDRGTFVITSIVSGIEFDDLLSDVLTTDNINVCVVGNIFDNPKLLE